MRRFFLPILILSTAAQTNAQIMQQRYQFGAPSVWVTAGAGFQDSWAVNDGTTGSQWQFGTSTQYAASLEKSVSNGVNFGVRGTTASVPMTYSGLAGPIDADANVSQVFATVHAASGGQFHTLLEISGGTTIYSKFQARGSGAKLGTDSPGSDFTYAFGYGAGFALAPSFVLDVVRENTTAKHSDTGLAAGSDTKSRWSTTRLVARIGF